MLNHSGRLRLVLCGLAVVLAVREPQVLGSDPSRPVTHQTTRAPDPGRPVAQPAPALSLSNGPGALDEWVERAMKTFEVPGLALTIVKHGQVVVAKGYSVRKLGEWASVDARTLFGRRVEHQGVHGDGPRHARDCFRPPHRGSS